MAASPETSEPNRSPLRFTDKTDTMAVAIRLRREGNKNRPYYRIIVADKRTRRDGPYIDAIGTYDPMQDGENTKIDLAKADDWISKGAQPSETVASIIKKERSKASQES